MAQHGPYTETQCKTCGVWHCIPSAMYNGLQETGGYYHCPNGHQWGWRQGRQERDNLRRERDRAVQNAAYEADLRRREADRANAAERRAAGYKGAATRLKNRAKAGVCPCCNRSFQDLARHMASKHSEADLTNVVEIGQGK